MGNLEKSKERNKEFPMTRNFPCRKKKDISKQIIHFGLKVFRGENLLIIYASAKLSGYLSIKNIRKEKLDFYIDILLTNVSTKVN